MRLARTRLHRARRTTTWTPAPPSALPYADANGPYSGTAGTALNVTSAGSYSPNGAWTATWDWGDGSPVSTGTAPSHTYVDQGTYTITLTVTDAVGSTSDTATATIAPSAATVASVEVSPDPVSGYVGDAVQLTAVARDAGDAVIGGKTGTWASTNTGVATVPAGPSAGAVVSLIAPGSAGVRCTIDTVPSNLVAVSVSPRPAGGTHPHEPSGMTRFWEQDYTVYPDTGIYPGYTQVGILAGWHDPSNDPQGKQIVPYTVPTAERARGRGMMSGPYAKRVLFQGFNAGSGTHTVCNYARTDTEAAFTEFYAHARIRVYGNLATFQGHAPGTIYHANTTLQKFFYHNAASRTYRNRGAIGPGGAGGNLGSHTYWTALNVWDWRINEEWNADGTRIVEGADANLLEGGTRPLVGDWFDLEWYGKVNTIGGGNPMGNADGIARCWINGVEQTFRTTTNHPLRPIGTTTLGRYDVRWRTAHADFDEPFFCLQWEPIWGGTGEAMDFDMAIDIDHFYVSGKV